MASVTTGATLVYPVVDTLCPCGGYTISDSSTGTVVCTECGCVLAERLFAESFDENDRLCDAHGVNMSKVPGASSTFAALTSAAEMNRESSERTRKQWADKVSVMIHNNSARIPESLEPVINDLLDIFVQTHTLAGRDPQSVLAGLLLKGTAGNPP